MTELKLALLFLQTSQMFNLPPGLLSAICYVESKHVIEAIHVDDGGSPSIGVCQVKLWTAKDLGFKGNEHQLANPRLNIFYAGKYLRNRINRYPSSIPKVIAAYNAGTARVDKDGYFVNEAYVDKVLFAWGSGR